MRFGRLQHSDARDKRFRLKRRTITRTSRYWQSRWFGEQQFNDCTGYAAAHWLEASPHCQWVDPTGVYLFARYLDDYPGEADEGTTVRATMKALQSLGFVQEYRWCWSVQALAETVAEVGPCIVGTVWTEEMCFPDREGVIHFSGHGDDGHAYLVDGINFLSERLRVKNSWSRDWGRNGRAWISFSDMRKLLRRDGEACCAVERRAAA